jgi:hypothetical protein
MTIDKVLPFIVVGLTFLLVGTVAGVWLGSRIEQNAIVTIVTRAELTPECRAQLDSAVKDITQAHEAPPKADKP